MKQALILVDIQNEYFPDGNCPLFNINEVSDRAASLLSFFREKNLAVIHIKHIEPTSDAGCFIEGTEGVEINNKVKPLASEKLIVKNSPNGFLETDLKKCLEDLNISSLVICGAMSHMCIDATTRAALDLGFDCSIIQDACTTMDLEFRGIEISASSVHAAFMAALEEAGSNVINLSDFTS
ncbi:MAG: cysteine hydrolase [Bdellovibrionales bacterium]|nr:cysteine hydrolase [Bdellovibrionales bacterium]